MPHLRMGNRCWRNARALSLIFIRPFIKAHPSTGSQLQPSSSMTMKLPPSTLTLRCRKICELNQRTAPLRHCCFSKLMTRPQIKRPAFLVTLLKTRIEELVRIYNARNGACKPDLAFDEIRTSFLQPAALVGNEHLRTLVTTFISFFLEWDHRYGLIGMRPEKGTAEPFFMHLFKGCLLFESLLKTSKAQPKQTALLGVLNELQGPLLLQKQIQGVQTTFPAVVQSLSADDGSVYSAIDLTYRLRNTTAHSLGWQVALGQKAYKGLVECIAVACLHALGCLYR
jgi:hypothetical protein